MVLKKIITLPLCSICLVGQISQAENSLILYPRGVGRISSKVGEDELATIYGKPNLTRVVLQEEDGRLRCATILFRGTNKEIGIFWRDDPSNQASEPSPLDQHTCDRTPSRRNPESVDIRANGGQSPSDWKTAHGVFAGITLLSLEQINGAPIEFEASESCSNGGIMNWNGGTLEKLNGLFSNSRMSFNAEDIEGIRRGDVVSSKDISDSTKMRIFLDRISFYLSDNAG
jgi:hypothetical protein